MKTQELSAKTRSTIGKNKARQLREQGLIPAVCYGKNVPAMSLAVSPLELKAVLAGDYGRNAIIELDVEGNNHRVILKDFEIDPVYYDLLHVDFYVVEDDSMVEVDVPIRLVGRAQGQTLGGELRQVQRQVHIRCLPKDIPVEITFDVTPLKIKQRALASQLTPPEGVELLFKADFAFAQVNAPRGAEVGVSDEDEAEEEEAE